MDEFMPKDIENLKLQIREDLQTAVNRFNSDVGAWEARTSCFANFKWIYGGAGGKRLAVTTIDLPIVKEEPSEEAVEEARRILEEANA